jgi:hypothetical protein
MSAIATAAKIALIVLAIAGPLLNYAIGFGMSNLQPMIEGI